MQETDIDNRMALYQHVVLSGGTTLLPGLPTRLERDIRALYLQHVLHVRCPHQHPDKPVMHGQICCFPRRRRRVQIMLP